MNAITNEFLAKTPSRLLNKYRRHMWKVGRFSCGSVVKAFIDCLPFGMNSYEDYFAAGSIAEGANLARQFSDDAHTSRELEIDFMIVVIACKEEKSITYTEKNEAFVHIKLEPSNVEGFAFCYAAQIVMDTCCQKEEDGLYLNGFSLKNWLNFNFQKLPNVCNGFGYFLIDTGEDCDPRSASIPINIIYKDDVGQQHASQEQGDDPSSERMTTLTPGGTTGQDCISLHSDSDYFVGDSFMEFLRQMKPRCKEFEGRIEGMLTHMEILQNEFVEMRSGEVSVSLSAQAAKALEWATTCMDITDFIFDTRRSTIFGVLHKHRELNGCGLNLEEQETKLQNAVRQKMKRYIDQLMTSAENISDQSVAAAVDQLLSDMERTDIARGGLLTAHRVTARMTRAICRVITSMDRYPEMCQISPDLRPLGNMVKKICMDIVPSCKLTFWPSVAGEWKTRDRLWPNQSVVDEIVNKGAHLVAKGCCHDDIDWRLSFSVAEIDLATRWSPAQHFVYFIFKALFYKFIKPLCDDDSAAAASPTISGKRYVASYMAKTAMMWTSESFEQSWWTENDAPECLTVLLLALQSAYECRALHHYFIASVNLLEGVSDVVAQRVIDTINSILADPGVIADQLKRPFEKTLMFLNAMDVQQTQLETVGSYLTSCFRDLW